MIRKNWYKIYPGQESEEFRKGVEAFANDEGFDSLDSVEARMGFFSAFAKFCELSEHSKSPFLDPYISRRMNDLLYVGTDDAYSYYDGYWDFKN